MVSQKKVGEFIMGQYYLGYVKHGENKIKVFNNRVDGEWTGLKLMEHSYWLNSYVGNVVNDLFYNKGQVCWVGDYYNEDDYSQINCDDKETVKTIGQMVWSETKGRKQLNCTRTKVRYLFNCLIVNHTKKLIIVCDDYYNQNKWLEKWEDEEWEECIHPLPLLTCSASHSGGSYRGINHNECGSWFNDEIEIVLRWELEELTKKGYQTVMYEFSERS